MTEYERRLAALFTQQPPLSVEDLIDHGRDLDARVTLPRDADWEDLDVPDDTVPGE